MDEKDHKNVMQVTKKVRLLAETGGARGRAYSRNVANENWDTYSI